MTYVGVIVISSVIWGQIGKILDIIVLKALYFLLSWWVQTGFLHVHVVFKDK